MYCMLSQQQYRSQNDNTTQEPVKSVEAVHATHLAPLQNLLQVSLQLLCLLE